MFGKHVIVECEFCACKWCVCRSVYAEFREGFPNTETVHRSLVSDRCQGHRFEGTGAGRASIVQASGFYMSSHGVMRNTLLLTRTPADVVTFTGPYWAPGGTEASISPGATTVNVACAPPLNVTSVALDRSVP